MEASRRQRFRRRLEIERQVLTQVNGAFFVSQPLAGITEIAVQQWGAGLGREITPSAAEKVIRLINEIAKRASFDSDCSRDIFEEDELVSHSSVDFLITQLKVAVDEINLIYASEKRERTSRD